jgi:D-alanine transaminase
MTLNAREAFITSAMNLVTPVIAIDGKTVGEGKPGPVAARLRAAYIERCAIH